MDVPGWFSNVSSSSLATTILSLSALSMTKMIAWPSLTNKKKSQGVNVWKKQQKGLSFFRIAGTFTCSNVPKGFCICLDQTCQTLWRKDYKNRRGERKPLLNWKDNIRFCYKTNSLFLFNVQPFIVLIRTATWMFWTSLCWSQWLVQCLVPGPEKYSKCIISQEISHYNEHK